MRIRKFHLDMVNKIAGGFHKTTGLDQKELFAQGCLALCKAIQSYSKSRGDLKYYISQCVRYDLINFIKEENKYSKHVDLEYCYSHSTNNIYFFEKYDSLPSDVKEIIDHILKNPYEYLTVPNSLSVSMVKINLFKEKNWKQLRVNKALKKLKESLVNT